MASVRPVLGSPVLGHEKARSRLSESERERERAEEREREASKVVSRLLRNFLLVHKFVLFCVYDLLVTY